jgi:hypothetical protein
MEASQSNELFACNYQIQICDRATNLRAAQRTRKSTFPKIKAIERAPILDAVDPANFPCLPVANRLL